MFSLVQDQIRSDVDNDTTDRLSRLDGQVQVNLREKKIKKKMFLVHSN